MDSGPPVGDAEERSGGRSGAPDFRSEWRLRTQRHRQWALMLAMVTAVSTETRAEVDSLTWKAHEEVEEEQEAGH